MTQDENKIRELIAKNIKMIGSLDGYIVNVVTYRIYEDLEKLGYIKHFNNNFF